MLSLFEIIDVTVSVCACPDCETAVLLTVGGGWCYLRCWSSSSLVSQHPAQLQHALPRSCPSPPTHRHRPGPVQRSEHCSLESDHSYRAPCLTLDSYNSQEYDEYEYDANAIEGKARNIFYQNK